MGLWGPYTQVSQKIKRFMLGLPGCLARAPMTYYSSWSQVQALHNCMIQATSHSTPLFIISSVKKSALLKAFYTSLLESRGEVFFFFCKRRGVVVLKEGLINVI